MHLWIMDDTSFKYNLRIHSWFSGDSSVTEYITVRLTKAVGSQIDDVLENTNLGYRSRAEFVTEAIRDKILNLKNNPGEAS